jgi:cytochrome c-type biogenesis protein CcmF
VAWAFEARSTGRICTGSTRQLGSWQVSLREIMPVAGTDYTGLQVRLKLLGRNGETVQARPELRDYFASHHAPLAGADTLVRWGGELLVQADGDRDSPDCAGVSLVSRPFARWQLYGAWLAALVALLMAAAGLRSAWWRADAWRRIGERRADRKADTP